MHTTDAPLYGEVTRAADRIARRSPGIVESDDLAHDIYIDLMESRYLSTVAGMDPAARADVLGRIGGRIAARLVLDHDHYSGQHTYGTDEVRSILTRGALTEQSAALDVERLDLRDGLLRLNEGHHDHVAIIADVYMLGEPVGSASRRKRLQRAVDALTRLMNRTRVERARDGHDGPGARTAVSNRAAQALTTNQY